MRIRELFEQQVVLDPEREMVVFRNPSKTELRSLLDRFGELRGSASPDGPLYVWDANTWVHHTIHKYLGHMPFYLYFSKTRDVQATEWQKRMRRRGSIFVGIGYEDDSGKNRPDIVLAHPMVARIL